MKKINFLLITLLGLVVLSCSNNTSNNSVSENKLVGIWLRIDSNTTFQERYVFNADQTGSYYFHDGSFTKFIESKWQSSNNILTLIPNDGSVNTTVVYEISSNGQLILANDVNLTYSKIN